MDSPKRCVLRMYVQGVQARITGPRVRRRCDLREYWEENPVPRVSPERMRWASKQILRLAGVLREMDGYVAEEGPEGDRIDRFAYHGDVKAENVLLFDDAAEPLGRLVLADVGSGGCGSPSDAPNKYRATPCLRPPDYDVRGESDPRSRDRWAFGCFLFDFVIWLLAGTGAIDDFEDERFSPYPMWGHRVDSQIYFDLREWRGGTALVIKEAVLNVHRRPTRFFRSCFVDTSIQKFAEMHANPACSPYLHDLLDFVEAALLIVESDDRKRASCDAVYEKLSQMKERCFADVDYCVKPSPRPSHDTAVSRQRPVLVQLSEEALRRVAAFRDNGGSVPVL